MINTSRSAYAQQVRDYVVEPMHRTTLLPDQGTATLASGKVPFYIGTGSPETTIWEAIVNVFQNVQQAVGSILNLQTDDILVDVLVRTPQGVKLIPNLPLHLNNIGNTSRNEILKGLHDNVPLDVRIVYAGGRPSECSPISFRFNYPTSGNAAQQAQVDQAGTDTSGGEQGGGVSSPPSYGGGQSGILADAMDPGIYNNSLFFNCDRLAHPGLYEIRGFINEAGHYFKINPNIIAAICQKESAGNMLHGSACISSSGCKGAMQLAPTYFPSFYASALAQLPSGVKMDYDIWAPRTSVYCGAWYLSSLHNQFNNWKQTYAAYNGGPGTMEYLKNVARVTLPVTNGGHLPENDTYGGQERENEMADYYKKVSEFFTGFQSRSNQLGAPVISRRPETKKIDVTNANMNSGKNASGSLQ